MTRYLWAALIVCMATGCAIQPPAQAPNPEHDGSAAIGLTIELRTSLGWPTYRADGAYFIRLDANSPHGAGDVFVSNYWKDGRLYLLNAPPGDYIVVGAYFKLLDPGGARQVYSYTTHFPRDLIEQTRVSVGKGDFAYAGRFLVEMSGSFCPADADDMQRQYAFAISSADSFRCGSFLQELAKELATNSAVIGNRVYSRRTSFTYRGSALQSKRDESARASFFEQAKPDLAEAGWSNWLK